MYYYRIKSELIIYVVANENVVVSLAWTEAEYKGIKHYCAWLHNTVMQEQLRHLRFLGTTGPLLRGNGINCEMCSEPTMNGTFKGNMQE